MADTQYYEGLGRRKEATARVRLHTGGTGNKFVVNDKPMTDYFSRELDRVMLVKPLEVTGTNGRFDITVKVNGGGVTGQTDAIKLAIARALLKADPEYRKKLRENGFLSRDPRAKERKKPGLKRARKAPQYTKR
ncbi:MAG: 30S ribosomal protein S9 [Anaerolineae bacterium]|nr:30S ribosomal protein S9 [Anaerolineae bacterium]MCB0179262.1 30S ribosomal protein S9 [Anaerolineae bacterium]MCB9103156.1 30S ribosomal protein S9 [Anaerolineales bacterium]